MDKTLRAIEFAIRAHGMQPRKYMTRVPYILHCVRVMRKILRYIEDSGNFRESQETMLVVAALHDTVEDVDGITLSLLEQEFGADVAEGVRWLTNPSKDHPKLRRAERKAMDIDHLARAPRQWQVLKMLDRIDNLLDMANADVDFILDLYVPESRILLERLGEADRTVATTLEGAIDWLASITRGRTRRNDFGRSD